MRASVIASQLLNMSTSDMKTPVNRDQVSVAGVARRPVVRQLLKASRQHHRPLSPAPEQGSLASVAAGVLTVALVYMRVCTLLLRQWRQYNKCGRTPAAFACACGQIIGFISCENQ